MNMELGATGELVGGIVVIASLSYLVVQLRHASHERIKLAGDQTRVEAAREVLLPMIETETGNRR